jgi:hypothetical protein
LALLTDIQGHPTKHAHRECVEDLVEEQFDEEPEDDEEEEED